MVFQGSDRSCRRVVTALYIAALLAVVVSRASVVYGGNEAICASLDPVVNWFLFWWYGCQSVGGGGGGGAS